MTSSNRNAAFELAGNGFSDLDDEFFTEIFPEMFDTSGESIFIFTWAYLLNSTKW